MTASGLVISAAGSDDGSAYTHRLRELAKGLQRCSIHCDFFFMPEHPPLHKMTTASLFLPFYLRTLQKYDFIHSGDEEATQAMLLCRPLIRGLIVWDVHGDVAAQAALRNATTPSAGNRRNLLRVRLFARMARLAAHHALCVSNLQRNALVESGFPAHRVSVVRNGVNLDLFQQLPQPLRPRFTFAYVGEFQVWQGIPNLLEAFARLTRHDARLMVVGFRDSDQALKHVFREKFGSRVELLDRTDRQSLRALVQDVAIFVIPRVRHDAIRHAFPTKFGEYAALGRPIIVTDVDETADFVRKYRCGWVAEPSGAGLAETMEIAAGCSHDALAEMGARARVMAEENFSWEKIGLEYGQLIGRLTAAVSR
jgi:glycosyltransferase involved in cell wall biosynthesis